MTSGTGVGRPRHSISRRRAGGAADPQEKQHQAPRRRAEIRFYYTA
ncbi:hypothetical protein ACFFX0_31880 [Citricoccus parietis]|uniref:Uncharacterized protein n=1 Tax=Citricoccus parietis TaxID=592307 RepID=A0ABV5G9G6_9MICC